VGVIRWARHAVLLVGAISLAACMPVPSEPTAKPQVRPAGLGPQPQPTPAAPSEASKALTRYYARLQNDLLAQDLLRTGGGGVDTPYTETDLSRNFERIAFYNEYQRDGGLKPAGNTPEKLKKWTQPVRIGIEFGASVTPEKRALDTKNITAFANRLSRVTGHPVSVTNRNPNFYVLVMSEDDRAYARSRALEIMPGFARSNLVLLSNLPRAIQCFVIAAGRVSSEYEYNLAIAYIRAEGTDLQRLACIHEELAQGMGLANDSPRARPSIFNDDEEFALLTTHDEELLRLLYNPALRPGMSLDEARPIIARILAGRYGPS
jgi:hypothetical protein